MKCIYCGMPQGMKWGENILKPFAADGALICGACFVARPDLQRAYVESHREEFGIPADAVISEIVVKEIKVGPHGPGCDCDWPVEKITVH